MRISAMSQIKANRKRSKPKKIILQQKLKITVYNRATKLSIYWDYLKNKLYMRKLPSVYKVLSIRQER